MKGDRIRLTVDMHPDLNAAIEAYCENTGRSKAAAFRTAIDLLLHADKARENGFTVGAWRQTKTGLHTREFIL